MNRKIHKFNFLKSDHKIRTYKTTTLPTEHSTPNQLQWLTATSSSTQFDKAPKGSLTIPCLNFRRALPAHRTHFSALFSSRKHTNNLTKIENSTNQKLNTFFIQRATGTKQPTQRQKEQRIPEAAGFPVFFHSCCVQTSTGQKKSTIQIEIFFKETKLKEVDDQKDQSTKVSKAMKLLKHCQIWQKGESPNHVLRPRKPVWTHTTHYKNI